LRKRYPGTGINFLYLGGKLGQRRGTEVLFYGLNREKWGDKKGIYVEMALILLYLRPLNGVACFVLAEQNRSKEWNGERTISI
jgi:hypothetical protein